MPEENPQPGGHRIDIVVPIYNEAGIVERFHGELSGTLCSLDCGYRVIYVDDGSTDSTLERLIALGKTDHHVMVVELSRNFGHQAALTAGLSLADGDWVITMDGDGQHPPSLIPEMVALARQGYDVVLSHRLEQRDLGLLKRWTSRLFYRLINFIGSTQLQPGGADFRLMNATTLAALRALPEYHRFLRGMVAWLGFRSILLPFSPGARFGGETRYSPGKMLRLAADAIFSFSLAPLYLALTAGCVFLLLAFLEAGYILFTWLRGQQHQLTPGWASLMFIMLSAGGAILITSGITGLYVGYIFQEVKRRPVFLIRALHSHPPD